jgi:hypothetical protein
VIERFRVGTAVVLSLLIAAAGATGASEGEWMFAFFAWGVALGSLFAAGYWLRNPTAARSSTPLAAYLLILGVEALAAGVLTGGAVFRVCAILTAAVALALGASGLRRGAPDAPA